MKISNQSAPIQSNARQAKSKRPADWVKVARFTACNEALYKCASTCMQNRTPSDKCYAACLGAHAECNMEAISSYRNGVTHPGRLPW